MSDDPRDEIIKQFHKPCRCDHSFYEACCGNDYATQRALAGEIIRLRAAIERVRELHYQIKGLRDFCGECEFGYPCDTILAVDGDAAEQETSHD